MLVPVLASFLLGQAVLSGELKNSDLPVSPLQHGETLVVDDLSFYLIPAVDWGPGADPHKTIPCLVERNGKKPSITWQSFSDNYVITDDELISIPSSKKDSEGNTIPHNIRIVRYRIQHPWADVDQAIILYCDNKIFSISFGDALEDHPSISTYVNLSKTDNGDLRLDVAQEASGTGAYNTDAIFAFPLSGPRLVQITEGGRDH